MPQSTSTPLKQVLTRIALRGRKRGLGIILMSQRSAKVEKDVLTQASLLFLHKVVHPIDLKVYKDLIPLPPAQVEDMVRRLRPGEAIVVYNHEATTLQIRQRYTFHAGSTPTWNRVAQPKLRKIDAVMLKELRTLTVGAERKASVDNEQAKMANKIKDLEETITLKDAEIRRLQQQIDLLSKLSVSIEGLPNTSLFSATRTLSVDQAIVGQVITERRSTQGDAKTTDMRVSHLSEPETFHKGVSLTLAEQRKLDSMIERFKRLPKLQRSILHLLFEHEGTTMTVPMMASWLSLKESTIRSHPPYDLMKMKLITRVRGSRGYKYASSVSAYLRAEFPRVDLDAA